jgi:hypothetical protein
VSPSFVAAVLACRPPRKHSRILLHHSLQDKKAKDIMGRARGGATSPPLAAGNGIIAQSFDDAPMDDYLDPVDSDMTPPALSKIAKGGPSSNARASTAMSPVVAAGASASARSAQPAASATKATDSRRLSGDPSAGNARGAPNRGLARSQVQESFEQDEDDDAMEDRPGQNYENPWDEVPKSSAGKRTSHSSSSSTNSSQKQQPQGPVSDGYEDPWDNTPQLKASSGHTSPTTAQPPVAGPVGDGYEDPWDHPAPVSNPPRQSQLPSGPVGDGYEDPWDNPAPPPTKSAAPAAARRSSPPSGRKPAVVAAAAAPAPAPSASPAMDDATRLRLEARKLTHQSYKETYDGGDSFDDPPPLPTGTRPASSASANANRKSLTMTTITGRTVDLEQERQTWRSQPYFHGTIDRHVSEAILVESPDGSFLIREKAGDPYDLSLSFRTGEEINHMKIKIVDGQFVLGERSRPFSSVPGLIDFFRTHDICVKGGGKARLVAHAPRPR